MPSVAVWALAPLLMLSPAVAQTGTTPDAVPAETPVDLTFLSSPTGSSVWMGGKKLGHTPLKTKLPAGSATLIFRPAVAGYAPQSKSFVWRAGETHRIVVELPMTYGEIRLATARSWTSITFDAQRLAIQPGKWTRVQAGRHRVIAVDGRYAATMAVRIPENGRAQFDLAWRKFRPETDQFFLVRASRSAIGSAAYSNLNPPRKVAVDGYWIQRNEVRVRDYRGCVNAGRCRAPAKAENCNWNVPGRDEHPINCVSASQAIEYAAWFSAKDEFTYRLPTNVEWEHVATAGGSRAYPWGNSTASGRCNICDQSCPWKWRDPSVNDGWSTTAPAASFMACAGPEGVLDLIGNVAEWCSTIHTERYDLRGGSWSSPKTLYDPVLPNMKDREFQDATTGFRLAATAIKIGDPESTP